MEDIITRAQCGTRHGYQLHKRMDAQVCGPCAEAQSNYDRGRYVPVAKKSKGCAFCATPFLGSGNRRYCSIRCRDRASHQRRLRIPCNQCGGPSGIIDSPSLRLKHPEVTCNPCRRSRPGYKPRVSGRRKDRTEENVCERCDEVWTRPVTKGQRPKYCPDCRGDYRRWIPIAVRRGVYERDSWVCGICLEHVDEGLIGSGSPWRPSLDHVVPRSEGGSDDPENLRLSHFWCNGVLNDGRAYSDDDFRIAS